MGEHTAAVIAETTIYIQERAFNKHTGSYELNCNILT